MTIRPTQPPVSLLWEAPRCWRHLEGLGTGQGVLAQCGGALAVTIPSCQWLASSRILMPLIGCDSACTRPLRACPGGPGPNQRWVRNRGLDALSPPLQSTGASRLRERARQLGWGRDGALHLAPFYDLFSAPDQAAFSHAPRTPERVPPAHPFPRSSIASFPTTTAGEPRALDPSLATSFPSATQDS